MQKVVVQRHVWRLDAVKKKDERRYAGREGGRKGGIQRKQCVCVYVSTYFLGRRVVLD